MSDNLGFALDGAWQVLLASLVFGAGLPVVYAFGIRAFAWGAGGDAEVSHARANPVGYVVGALCVLVVLAGVVLGITIIAAAGFGKAVSFEHGYPTIVAKE
ncbi:hypothetical protein [Nocardioides mangrovi]|uniref:DUF4190 domain-containing protein n=1 Tax=Nocardioides mangrovi TaxID=2874580 RepID=A0ABS7U7E2_9ACTN|nr:hypothetical protein [Nocardioides mangrovi]MBZ5736885.1 hypothetical protein [Nocardioides mangrovi]